MERSAESPTATDAMTPVMWPSQRRPKRPLTRKAASGNAGMSQTSEITACPISRLTPRRHAQGWMTRSSSAGAGAPGREARRSSLGSTSSLHLVDLVDVDHRPVAICREDDRQADRDLGGRDHEHEDNEDAAALVYRAVLSRERDEREVRRVQHELHT